MREPTANRLKSAVADDGEAAQANISQHQTRGKKDNARRGEASGVAMYRERQLGVVDRSLPSRLSAGEADENALTYSVWVAPRRRTEVRRMPSPRKSLRKEVIQPQVLLRLPCYDLVPVTDLAVGTTVTWRLRALPAPMT